MRPLENGPPNESPYRATSSSGADAEHGSISSTLRRLRRIATWQDPDFRARFGRRGVEATPWFVPANPRLQFALSTLFILLLWGVQQPIGP